MKKHASSKEVEELIRSTFLSIEAAIEKQLGHPVEINAIGYPKYFKAVPYVTTVAQTAIKVYSSIKDAMQVGPHMDYIRLAYDLNTPEGLRYAPGADLDDYHSLLWHFDYQKEFLEVSIMHVTAYADIRERLFRIEGFGGSDNVALQEAIDGLKTRLQTLLDEQIRDNGYLNTQPEDFRFIIFSGSASASEFQKIRQAIVDVVPDLSDRFLDSIDPFWVSAVGAARCAKEYAIDPPDHHRYIDFQVVNDDPEYDRYFVLPADFKGRLEL